MSALRVPLAGAVALVSGGGDDPAATLAAFTGGAPLLSRTAEQGAAPQRVYIAVAQSVCSAAPEAASFLKSPRLQPRMLLGAAQTKETP